MKRWYLVVWLVGGLLLLVSAGLWLAFAAPTPVTSEASRVIPTPAGGQPLPTPSGPTATPNAIRQELAALRQVAPDARVRMGAIVPVTPTPAPARYTIERPTLNGLPALVLHDAETGQTIRLGTDQGSAMLEARSHQYLIWNYSCYRCAADVVPNTGLYAYALATQTLIPIGAQHPVRWYPKVSGEWVVYLSEDADSAVLRAQHLGTGEELVVADPFNYRSDMTGELDPMPFYLYALAGQTIAWSDKGIHLYDLTTRTRRTLPLPHLVWRGATALSLSGEVVVWRGWGYDLGLNELFPLITTPPGWENLQRHLLRQVTVRDDQLSWSFDVNGQEYFFTAPIVRSP